MVSRRLLLGATIVCLLVGVLGVVIYAQQRIDRCAYVPLVAGQLLPNANLATPGDISDMPQGWSSAAPGVRLGEFAVDGDRRSLQLIGIANYVQTPAIAVQPGRSYCFRALAITDSDKDSATRLRVSFHWRDVQEQTIAEDTTLWQPVVLWRQDAPPAGWSSVTAAFRAPAEAAALLVRLHPASDDRVYLDAMHVRRGGAAEGRPPEAESSTLAGLSVEPWPNGKRAALSFSFDWETAMGGLIHSRSLGDPNFDANPEQRGLRMREGVTTTLEIFRPYGIRATYYATGYNFLLGNTARTQFMGNPTYDWANTEPGHRWLSDRWRTTPWFADDPYGTAQSHPAWYFGDLIPLLQREQQDIQSHTFSHFYGGFVDPQDWRDDIATWNQVAAERGVPPMRSLAFPWSSSAGMSDASWNVLQEAGITSVTRLSHQSQYNLFPRDEHDLAIAPRCRPLPGHARILACPDFYLTPESAERAIAQINRTLEVSGTIDLWAHTEEVVTDEQRAAWERVVRYAAMQDDLWIAPLREITDWQQALAQVETSMQNLEPGTQNQHDDPLVFAVMNQSVRDLEGLTVKLPYAAERVTVDGQDAGSSGPGAPVLDSLVLNLPAGATVEVQAWPAS